MKLSRREALVVAAGALAASRTTSGPAAAQDAERHGMSAFGDLKYPADFRNFDYVDPKAQKGGNFSQIGPGRQFNQNMLTFNSLNAYILKGDAAQGMELTFATLMVRASDEPDAMYGFAAKSVKISADSLTYRFAMRPEARFHDGSTLTAQDAAWSLRTLKTLGHPIIGQLLRDMLSAEAEDDTTLVVTFALKRGRDVPLFVASLPLFSRAYYAKRTFDESTLDVPLGSGAYKVGKFEAGRYIEYERVKDFWGVDLPVNLGQNNFDIVRFEMYRDRDVGFEGFTAKNYLFREEFTSVTWATRYNFPAIKDGRVKRDELHDDTPSGAQGWFINTRRAKFKDPLFREALNYAFDFEWTNKNIMFNSYDRTQSMFQNSDMMAQGKPSPEELVLLEPFRGKVPDEVFGEPFVPPVSDGSGQDRTMLRKAVQLMQQANIVLKDGKRITPDGQPISIEFLLDEQSFMRHHAQLVENLRRLGIDANVRLVDAVQYRARRDDFDFDITIDRFGFSTIPGDVLRSYFSSQAAQLKGSNNLSGMADPVIDALIDAVIAADSRPALVTAARALDRVIRSGRYWIPQWYKASHWIAYWDVFARPAADKPRYARGIPETWWYDRDKAARIDKAG